MLNNIDFALFLIRLVMGVFFLYAGYRKLFMPGGTQAYHSLMSRLNRADPFTLYAVPLGQVFGGLALVIGFLTPLAALGLVVILIGALRLVCIPKVDKANPEGPLHRCFLICMHPEVAMILALDVLILCGAGTWSIDYLVMTLLTSMD